MYMFHLLSSPGQGNPGFSGTDGKTAEAKEGKNKSINTTIILKNIYRGISAQKKMIVCFLVIPFFFVKEATFIITILFQQI